MSTNPSRYEDCTGCPACRQIRDTAEAAAGLRCVVCLQKLRPWDEVPFCSACDTPIRRHNTLSGPLHSPQADSGGPVGVATPEMQGGDR